MEVYGLHEYGGKALGFIFLKNIHLIKLSTRKYPGIPNPENVSISRCKAGRSAVHIWTALSLRSRDGCIIRIYHVR
jgi:hypothetical protein